MNMQPVMIEDLVAAVATGVGIVASITTLLVDLYLKNRRLRKELTEARSKITPPTADEVARYGKPSRSTRISVVIALLAMPATAGGSYLALMKLRFYPLLAMQAEPRWPAIAILFGIGVAMPVALGFVVGYATGRLTRSGGDA